jgi:cis-3-alkyl-4-acyloxetan-2-one decarboxylase
MTYNGDMFRDRVSRLWHTYLNRPYRLYVGIDQNPSALHEVVLLHGIGRSASTWHYVAENLVNKPYHILAFDLLGFGQSPKPTWPEYDIDDHAKAVISALLRKRRQRKPVLLVGHSMGCLIAVRIAMLRPDLVSGLILYQPPLYVGLPDKRRYNVRTDLYFRIYKSLIEGQEKQSQSRLQRLIVSHTGMQVQPEIVQPFVKSLQHTIMGQTTLRDMRKLKVPIEVVYGTRDLLVIRGTAKNVFKDIAAPLQTHTIRELHMVSKKASLFLAKLIDQALNEVKY